MRLRRVDVLDLNQSFVLAANASETVGPLRLPVPTGARLVAASVAAIEDEHQALVQIKLRARRNLFLALHAPQVIHSDGLQGAWVGSLPLHQDDDLYVYASHNSLGTLTLSLRARVEVP